ncbi:MAG TPA: nitroreductase [Chitinophagales bacterium]|nr:nitroreductase [Chitinophagales bacterium]
MNFNTREISRLIRQRRSIPPEQFIPGGKVDDSIIDEMLENANWAPTHGITEPWRFMVFCGEGLRKLAQFQAELYRKLTPASEFKQPKYDKLLQRPLLASHVIAIGMKRQESGKIPEVEEIAAVACAVQNMFLTAAAHGIAAYWTTGGITYEEPAKEFFGLGEKDRLLGFFYIGYAQKHPEGKRSAMSEKVKWVKGL